MNGSAPTISALPAASVRAGVAAVSVGIGVAIAIDPALGLGVGVFAGLTILVLLEWDLVWWHAFVASLAGALILGYGFANVGIRTEAVPIPLSGALLLLLLLRAVLGKRVELPSTSLLILIASFILLTLVHLAFDYGRWGREAVRDATLPFDAAWMVIGYWMFRRYGADRWIKALRFVFIVFLAYLALRPWYPFFIENGPEVGLQRPVPLFGDVSTAGTGMAAGLLFFALVRPFGILSYFAAAAFLPFIALAQSRGIYLALPAAFLLTWLLVRRTRRQSVTRGFVATIGIGSFALALFFPFAPPGRLGPTTPAFFTDQVATLVGAEGPGSGSIEQRVDWFRQVSREVSQRRNGWLMGLGLGPDLTEGFRFFDDKSLVRKPHNDYLEVFARLGLPGLLLFLAILSLPFSRTLRTARHGTNETEGRLATWVLATSIVFMLIAATQPILAYPYGTIPLYAILGAGYAAANEIGTRAQSRSRMTLR